MPYPLPFVKINVEGHFGTSTTNFAEYWQAGFHLTKNGGVVGGTSELSSFLTNIRASIITFHQTLQVASGATTWLDAVSGAYIGTDGNYALGSLQTTTRVPFTTVTAGTGTTVGPFATATCITLRSTLLRGPASHGRIYWPTTAAQVTSGVGTLAPAVVTPLLAAAVTMVNTWNSTAATNFGTGCNVGLVSKVGSGFQAPVTRVGIGQKLDHMESRERNLNEAHVYSNTTNSLLFNKELDDEFRRRMEELGDQADED